MPLKLPIEVIKSYDWKSIQEDHNNGLNIKDVLQKYNITRNRLEEAIRLELFTKVKHKQVMSKKARDKISAKRKEYLQNNPDSHPWRRANRNNSVPCNKFKDRLREHNIDFIEEYIPLTDRSYSIDIALPNKMIGIEINGQQHYDSQGKLKDYYQTRHNLIEAQGWTLYEIHYSLVWNETLFVDILNRINNAKHIVEFDFDKHNADRAELSKPNCCASCNKIISRYATRCKKCHNLNLISITPKKEKPTCTRHPLINKICPNCSNSFQVNYGNRKVICCSITCSSKLNRKVNISKEELHKLIWDKPCTVIGKQFNVSDNCINKLVKKYGLIKPPQTFWAKYYANKLEGFSCPLI